MGNSRQEMSFEYRPFFLKKRASVVLQSLILLVFSFCLPPPSSYAQVQSLTVGYSALTGAQAILHVIRDGSIFKKYGFEVNPVLIAGGSRAAMALIAGDFKILFTAAAPIVNPAARGADIVIIAGLANKLDYSFFASSEIKDPKDLKGKTIAISQPGTQGDFFARYLLVRWGLVPDKDAAMLQIGTQPDRFRALQTGRVQATMLQVPNTLMARRLGFTELAKAEDIDLEYQGTVVASTSSFLKSQPDVAKRFAKALVEGIHYYKTNRQRSIESIQKLLKLADPDLAEESYRFYSKLVSLLPYPTLKGLQTILEERSQGDPLVAKLKPESLVDVEALREIEKEGFVSRLYGQKVP